MTKISISMYRSYFSFLFFLVMLKTTHFSSLVYLKFYFIKSHQGYFSSVLVLNCGHLCYWSSLNTWCLFWRTSIPFIIERTGLRAQKDVYDLGYGRNRTKKYIEGGMNVIQDSSWEISKWKWRKMQLEEDEEYYSRN